MAMDKTESNLRTLQNIYAAALVDSLVQYQTESVLEKVADRKKKESMATGLYKARAFGIANPSAVFVRLPEVFGCASWNVELLPASAAGEKTLVARCSSCKLVALARRLGSPRPCEMYCLDPMEGMVRGFGATFETKSTMWDAAECVVSVKGKNL